MDSKIKSKLLTEIRVFLDAFFSYRYNIESAGKKIYVYVIWQNLHLKFMFFII